MGYPFTLTNSQQLAQQQGQETEKALKKSIDYEFKKYKENHQAWASTFQQAEQKRRESEKKWRDLYFKIYSEDTAWWKNAVMFALNAIQLYALVTQYKQQKEIADRTYELADRQLKLAEEMFANYKSLYQPHEVEMGQKINNYFDKPYRQQYETTGGRFVINARNEMIGKRRKVLMCASQYCTGATTTALKDLAILEAKKVSNALNSAVKYENTRQHKMTVLWLETRFAFASAGKGVSSTAVTGIGYAAKAFHSFGADPGSALSQLLNTIAYTVGESTVSAPRNPAPITTATASWVKPTTSVTREF